MFVMANETVKRLTRTEYDVLVATARGATGPEIARARGVSPNTVYQLRFRAYQKLGLRSSVEAVRWAIDKGLVSAGASN